MGPHFSGRRPLHRIFENFYVARAYIFTEVVADKEGFVIGKNINPNCDAGTRILHLGVNEIAPLPEAIPGHDDFSE